MMSINKVLRCQCHSSKSNTRIIFVNVEKILDLERDFHTSIEYFH